MVITFIALVFSIYREIYVGIPLAIGFLIFAFISWRRGFSLRNIMKMSFLGSKKALIVLQIFVLIGAITAIWMSAGTVPGIVYYGIKLMNPNFFIVYAFLISCLVSFLLGTSFGTVSTVGIALIVMAKGGSVNLNVAAGAIISGAYFGDRCSPMSSSANLVATLTGTNLFINIKSMLKTSVIPFALSFFLYLYFSFQEPLKFAKSNIGIDLLNTFKINWIVLLPAAIILLFSLFKINVKISMLFSIVIATIISIFLQGSTFPEAMKYLFLGFNLETSNPLYSIIQGGGIVSMWKASLIIFISCALSGIFEGTAMLRNIEKIFLNSNSHSKLFSYTSVVSALTAALGCSQSISVVLTDQLMSNAYKEKK